jgi:hypothetical protein
MIRAALIGLALGLLIAAGGTWQGYRHGIEVEAGRHAATLAKAQAATFAAAELASRIEGARLATQQRADDLARDLEDQAHADTTPGCGLPRARVLRLNRYGAP